MACKSVKWYKLKVLLPLSFFQLIIKGMIVSFLTSFKMYNKRFSRQSTINAQKYLYYYGIDKAEMIKLNTVCRVEGNVTAKYFLIHFSTDSVKFLYSCEG